MSMKQATSGIFLSFITIVVPSAIANDQPTSMHKNTKVSLRNCSIRPADIGRLETKPIVLGINQINLDRRCCLLTRLGGSHKVAVVEIESDGSVLLNPKNGFEYGEIPELGKMTCANTDELWGSDHVGGNYRKYHLYSSQNEEFVIEVVFDANHRIKKYRITSNSIKKCDWQTPEKKERGERY